MAAFLPDARLLDAIVALMALEAVALVVARARFGYGPSIVGALANCSAGACLILALRAAIVGASPYSIALFLGASLAAHLVDLVARWAAPRTAQPEETPAGASL